MEFHEHIRITTGALKRWLVAQTLDALAVGALWWIGLALIKVPFAPLWAVLAAMLQYIPQIGLVLALIGPAIAAAYVGGWEMLAWTMGLYAAIAVIDGFVLQPIFMKSQARVPIWASIAMPLLLGALFSFWGIVIAAPLLAVVYAYRARLRQTTAVERR